MKVSIQSPEYKQVLAKLIEMRAKAGLTQRELARKLEREYSFVWRIETGRRRLDVVEFCWVCKALGQDAGEMYQEVFGKMRSLRVTSSAQRKNSNA